jgi:hypothetical protein
MGNSNKRRIVSNFRILHFDEGVFLYSMDAVNENK